MAAYARIAGGIIVEMFTPPSGFSLADCFRPEVAASFVLIPPSVTPSQGWTYAAGVFAAPAALVASLAQQAAAMLATGCAVTSTGTPALNGIYAVDSESRADIQAELISILVNGVFTNGTTTFPWPDASGTTHTFTVAEFKALATALGAFVGTLKPIIASNSGTLPVQPSVIA